MGILPHRRGRTALVARLDGHQDSAARSAARADRRRIRRLVEVAGFEHLGAGLYRGAFPGQPGRRSPIWVELGGSVVIGAAVATTEGDALPDQLAEIDFGRYSVVPFPPFAALAIELPYTIDEAALRGEALELNVVAELWEERLAPALDLG